MRAGVNPTPLTSGPVAEQLAENRRAALRLVPVSRETEDRLATYVDLLARWRKTTNLIAESTFASVWTRHIADSAQLLALAPQARRWVDLGSGAGFPGLVIAIQLADVAGAAVHLIESDQRKCAFLREAVRVTGAAAQFTPSGSKRSSMRASACGRRDRARLRPLAADAQIDQTLDRPWRGWRVSARPIGRDASRGAARGGLMKSKSFRASSTQGQRSSGFAKAEKQGP